MKENRVVISGMGAITPIGTGVEKFWGALKKGKSGISKVSFFDVSDFRSKMAGEVLDFQASDHFDRKSQKVMDRFTQFAIVASQMALDDAELDESKYEPERTGVIIGSGIGGSQTIEDGYSTLINRGPRAMNPFFVSKLLINMAACMVSIKNNLKGPLAAPSVACSTGTVAIGDAFRILQRGDADIMLAGASEAAITPLPFGGFCATRSMSTESDPEKACRPFDKNRDGFVMGEGVGIVVLEALDHALLRGAKIYAELVGYGNTADAFHLTSPEPNGDGMKRVMAVALADAKISTDKVDYINAHGTSTQLNDKCESKAIGALFGERAKQLKVSSIKSMIGHLLSASGAVEFVSTVKSVNTGIIPPTINYSEADPECPLDYVTNGAESINLETAISNSFGFGGGNACLVVKKYRD
jgi:3-oxoacyl-[acyl-carrier-protein] synthase II